MYKAVFFDAIDTLFMAYPDKVGMYQRIIKKETGINVAYEEMSKIWYEILEETEKEARREACENKPPLAWDGFNAKILKKLNYTGDCNEKGERLRFQSWSNPENFHLYDDVISTLKKLKEHGYLIACVSNEATGLNNFFTHFGIKQYFNEIIISEEVGCEKPDNEIFELALTKLSLKPEEVIFVGDSVISDYEGSMKIGMEAILIDRDNKINDNNIKKVSNLEEILNIALGEKINASTTT